MVSIAADKKGARHARQLLSLSHREQAGPAPGLGAGLSTPMSEDVSPAQTDQSKAATSPCASQRRWSLARDGDGETRAGTGSQCIDGEESPGDSHTLKANNEI